MLLQHSQGTVIQDLRVLGCGALLNMHEMSLLYWVPGPRSSRVNDAGQQHNPHHR